MIVRLFNELISTENIYSISEIHELFYSSRSRNSCHESEHQKPFYFYFEIVFLNERVIQVNKDALYNPLDLMSAEEIKETVSLNGRNLELAERMARQYRLTEEYMFQKAEFSRVRDELINYWSNGQSIIPSIGFKVHR